MLVSSESLIPIIITLAAAAVGLCYLPIVMDVVAAITERQRKRRSVRQSAEQLEQKVLASHREILDEIEKQAKTAIKETKEKIEASYQNGANTSQQKIETATRAYLDETHIALEGLVAKAAERIDDELKKQLETTRTELENYKKAQIQKLDSEIATIVEKTIYKTLGRGLSRADHIDLIYKSLAEAKEENFFGNHVQ